MYDQIVQSGVEDLSVRRDCPYEFLSHLETVIPEWDYVFRRHVKVAALAVAGWNLNQIAQQVGYSELHTLKILDDYNQNGFFALLDKRRKREHLIENVVPWLRYTSACLNHAYTAEHFRAWFSPAPHLLALQASQEYFDAQSSENAEVDIELCGESHPYSSNNFEWSDLALFGLIGLIILVVTGVGMSKSQFQHPDITNPVPSHSSP